MQTSTLATILPHLAACKATRTRYRGNDRIWLDLNATTPGELSATTREALTALAVAGHRVRLFWAGSYGDVTANGNVADPHASRRMRTCVRAEVFC